MEGECLCKAVKVRINDQELFSRRRGHLCHCANCRKVAGGIFGVNLLIEEDKIEFPNGKAGLRVYEDPDTLSSTPVNRNFCGTCGCPVFSQTPLYKGMLILKLGLYPKLPQVFPPLSAFNKEPEWESFVKDKQKWEKPFEGTVQYKDRSKGEKMPDSM